MLTRIHGFFGLSALALSILPFGCSRFSSCEDTLSCGGSGGDSSGGASSGGSSLGGGGAASGGSGGTVDPCDECKGDTPLCNDKKECVACLENADCTDPENSLCDAATGSCEGCGANKDCAHLSDTPLCDVPSKSCVECKSETDCGGKVCAPDTHECTDTVARSKDICAACDHDMDCKEGQLCVEQTFESDVVGGYCTWTKAGRVETAAADKNCPDHGRPFAKQVNAGTSVDGAEAALCVLQTTTCPAFLEFRVAGSCSAVDTDNDACGIAQVDDGLCKANSVPQTRCTYPCGGNEDCKVGFACTVDGFCEL